MIIKLNKFVWVTALCSILLSTFLLIYKIHINSDMLFIEYLLQDMFNNHGHWRYWKLSPAPSYFPDMLVYLIGFFAFKTVPLRIFFVTVIQIFALSYLGNWLLKKACPSPSIFMQCLVQFFLWVAVIAANHTATSIHPMLSIGIFYISDNIQVPTVISSLLLLGLFLNVMIRPSWVTTVSILIIGAVALASSAVFFICFSIPFFLTLCVLVFIGIINVNAELVRRSQNALLILIFSQVLGYLLSNGITVNSTLEHRIVINIPRFIHVLHVFKDATLNVFDPSNMYSFMSAMLAAAAVVFALCKALVKIGIYWHNPRIEQLSIVMLSLFLLLSVFSSVGGSLISGAFIDIYAYRYFMTFIAVAFILTAAFLGNSLTAPQTHYATCILVLCMTSISALSAVQIIFLPGNRSLNEIVQWGAYPRVEQEIAACINELIESDKNIYSGIGDFWSSRAVMYYLENKVFIQPTLNNFEPFFWISSAESLSNPDKYGIRKYNFVILRNEKSKNQFDYDLGYMQKILPSGYEVSECKAGDSKIILYENNELDDLVRPVFKRYFIEMFKESEYNQSNS